MWRFAKRLLHQATIGNQAYRFMFRPGPPGEVVSIDCETTGLDPAKDDVVAIAAIRIRGNRILTSEAFRAVVRPGARMRPEAVKVHGILEAEVSEAGIVERVIPDLLHFIGGRPLLGYYLDFDVAMLDKTILPLIGIELPNPRIEVSRLYHERKYGNAPPGTVLDLTFKSLLGDLGIPMLDQHDAFDDALMTAMAYVKLMDLKQRGIRIARPRIGQTTHGPTF